jgi:hypothetical protein
MELWNSVASCWLFKKKSSTMYGNMNVKFTKICLVGISLSCGRKARVRREEGSTDF